MAVNPFPLLRLLADGELHSGSGLAKSLKLSRGAVSRRVSRIEPLGIHVLGIRGQGYRLSRPVDLLDAGALQARAARLSPALHLEVVDECDSTSTLLAERASRGAPHGAAVACEHQTAGRGRRGNPWIAAVGGSLAFSLLWRYAQGVAGLAGFSLAVAVMLARALEQQGVPGVQLKWPNDIVCGGKKLGGILVEISGDRLGPSTVIVGIGLNTSLDARVRSRIDQPITDVASCAARPPSRTQLLEAMLAALARGCEQFGREGFAAFRDEWTRRHAWQGRRVTLTLAGRGVVEGEALGIADDGSLMLRSRHGVERFHAGELSLRPA